MTDITKSILDLSDDEISKLDPTTLAFNSDADATANTDTETGDQEDHDLDDKTATTAAEGKDKQANTEVDNEDGEQGTETDKVDGAETASGTVDKDGAGKKTEPVVQADDGQGTKTEGNTTEANDVAIDYKAEYERLTGKFKANGREFQVANVDDAISLMQMGIGFNKKMAALKPNLKMLKILENNGLLDVEKLSFLVDVHKGDPAAINKLVLDSKIDPLDLTAEKASAYKPGSYSVDERELELDDVMTGLQDSPHFARTIEVVSQKWDKPSQKIVVDNPGLLEIVNDHIDRGIYDLIATEIERERMLGRLKGLSDIAAYQQVGDAMEAKGGFAHLVHKGTQTQEPAKVVVAPKPAKVDDPKLKDKRRAASSTKTEAPSSKAKVDFNLLGMSDDEFAKQMNPKFL